MIKFLMQLPGDMSPGMPHDPIVATIASAVLPAIIGAVTKPKPQNDPALAANNAKQANLLKAQQAEQLRQQKTANTQTTKIDANLAALQQAALARRSGQGSLAFAGPQTGAQLKTTFGG